MVVQYGEKRSKRLEGSHDKRTLRLFHGGGQVNTLVVRASNEDGPKRAMSMSDKGDGLGKKVIQSGLIHRKKQEEQKW